MAFRGSNGRSFHFGVVALAAATALLGAGCSGSKSSDNGNNGNNNGDTTPPTVISVTPTDGATDVAAKRLKISVTFSEDINTDMPSNDGLTISPTVTNWYAPASVLAADQRTVEYTLSDLAYNTTYTVTIANHRDRGANPNTMAPFSWTFTTGGIVYGNVAKPDLQVAVVGSKATLTWTMDPNATFYTLYTDLGDGNGEDGGRGAMTGTSVTSLPPGATVTFRVVGYDNKTYAYGQSTSVAVVLPAKHAAPVIHAYGTTMDVLFGTNGTSVFNVYCKQYNAVIESNLGQPANSGFFVVKNVTSSPQTLIYTNSNSATVYCAVSEVLGGIEGVPSDSGSAYIFAAGGSNLYSPPTTTVVGGDLKVTWAWGGDLVTPGWTSFYAYADTTSAMAPATSTLLGIVTGTPYEVDMYPGALAGFLTAAGAPQPYWIAVVPYYSDLAGNTSMASLAESRYQKSWSAGFVPFAVGVDPNVRPQAVNSNGDGRGLAMDGNSLYWMESNYAAIASSNVATRTVAAPIAVTTSNGGSTRDLVVVPSIGTPDIYYLDSGGFIYQHGASSDTALLTNAIASSPSDLTYSDNGGAKILWTTAANHWGIDCTSATTPATNATTAVTSGVGLSMIRSLRVAGTSLYFASTDGVKKISTAACTGLSTNLLATNPDVASVSTTGVTVRSIAIDGNDLYFIAGADGAAQRLMLGTPLDGLSAWTETELLTGLFSAIDLTYEPTVQSLFFRDGASGAVIEYPVSGLAAPLLWTTSATIYQPLADHSLFFGISGGIAWPNGQAVYQLPASYPIDVPLPTPAPIVSATAAATNITVKVETGSTGIGVYYTVDEIQPAIGTPFHGVVSAAGGSIGTGASDTASTYVYHVCPVNVAGSGACVDTTGVSPL